MHSVTCMWTPYSHFYFYSNQIKNMSWDPNCVLIHCLLLLSPILQMRKLRHGEVQQLAKHLSAPMSEPSRVPPLITFLPALWVLQPSSSRGLRCSSVRKPLLSLCMALGVTAVPQNTTIMLPLIHSVLSVPMNLGVWHLNLSTPTITALTAWLGKQTGRD